MSKKLIALLMVFGLVAAACGSDDAEETEGAAAESSEEASADEMSDDGSEMSDDMDEMSDEDHSGDDMDETSDDMDETSDDMDEMSDDMDETSDDMDEMSDEMDEMTESDASAGTVVDVAIAAGEFPTLVAAVQAAGLVDTLNGEGPFTVFAPTEEAFGAALEALGLTAEELLADTALLTTVLTYHVVPGTNMAADVVSLDGSEVATVQGENVAIAVDGDTVMVNQANVIQTDITASNGVIHVIDAVILPPSVG